MGAYLVDARIASGMTQKMVARKLGVSQPMVFKYESAEYGGCAVDIIEKVIDVLGLDVDFEVRPRSSPRMPSAHPFGGAYVRERGRSRGRRGSYPAD